MTTELTLNALDGQTLARHHISHGQTLHIAAQSAVHYRLADPYTQQAPDNVQLQRQGDDLYILIPEDGTLILDNYYGLDPTGSLYPILGNQGGLPTAYATQGLSELPHLLAGEIPAAAISADSAVSPFAILGGIAALGATGAVIAANRSDNSHHDDPSFIPEQPQTPFDPNQPAPPAPNPPAPNPPAPNPPAPNPPAPNPPAPNPPAPNPPAPNPPPAQNQAPTDIVLDNTTVAEGKEGVIVGKLTTIDPDAGDTHTYTVSDARFEVVNGELKLKAGQKLDFATEKTVSLDITTTDKAGTSHTEKVILQVQDDPNYPPLTPPVDSTPPVLTISVAKSDLLAGESTLVTFKVSEPVQNFESNDVVVKNGSLSGFTKVDDTTYTATFTADKSGQASLTVAPGTFSDLAWNQNDKASELALTIKDVPQQPNTPPTGEVKITGETQVGKTLTASNTLKDDDGLGKITYKWFANGTEVGQGNTYTIQPSDKGKTLTVKAEYTDGKGHAESVESAATAPIAELADTTPPILTISVAKSDLLAGESTLVTFKVSEPVQNFESNDVVVKNGTLSGFAKVNDTTYTATYTADQAGEASLSVAAGTFSDLAWNQNDKNAVLTLDIKDTPPPAADDPTVSLRGDVDVVEGQSAAYNIILDKAATQAVTVIVRVVHDNSDNGDVQATSYTVTIPAGEDSTTLQIPTLDNNSFAHGKTFRVEIANAQGAKINAQENSTVTAISDNDPPPPPQLEAGSEKGSAVITPQAGTQALTVHFHDESGTAHSMESYFDSSRHIWQFRNDPPAGITLNAQSGVIQIAASALQNGSEVRAENASEYNISESGTLRLNDGNDNTPDTTAPVLTISADKPFLTGKGESAQLTFKLSEPVQNFAANDIQVNNGRIDNFVQVDATTYTATYTGVGSGDIRVAAGAFSDLAFNQNAETGLRIPLSVPGNVVINGLPKVGENLSASITDDNGVPGVVQYQWLADGKAITSATQATYTVHPEDAGKTISVRVIYQDGENFSEDVTSDATAPVQGDNVHVFANIAELMAAPLKADDKALITDFNHVNDNIGIRYTISDTLPDAAQGLLNRVAVPLANGKYALPQLDDHTLPVENSAANIEAMLQVATTYLDAGDKLVWDGNGQTPLYVPGKPAPVKTPDGKDAYAITCSAFINMVMAGWKFEDTTYADGKNTSSYGWGIDFQDKPQGDKGPYGANNQLKWMYWKNQVALYNGKDGDEANYKVGDILFFSKQDPEGAGTGGVFFMNTYHSAIYIGNGKIMHSAGTYHGNGVVIETLNPLLKSNLTWIGRPHLGNSTITIEGEAKVGQTLTAKAADQDGLPADGITYQWYADNHPIDGATAQTYRLTDADKGKAITVRAKFTDSSQYAEAPTSTAVIPQASASAPNGRIELIGNTREGDTLTAKVSDADGVDDSQIDYQWFANRAPIAGANGVDYRLTKAEVGKQINVTAAYTDQAGNAESVNSDYSPAVQGAPVPLPIQPDPNLPKATLSGAASVQEGQRAQYTVSLDAPAPQDMSVDIRIRYESADSSDASIRYNDQRLIIKVGEQSATFSVETTADGIAESAETYHVEIGYPLAGTVYTYPWGTTPPAPVAPVDKQSVIIPSYNYPDNGGQDEYWPAVHAAGGGKIPFVIVNPASGAGEKTDPNYVKLIQTNIQAGIDNIAYIKTVYGTRPIAEVKAEMQKYFDLYGKDNIHGFFFDEIGTQTNQQTLYMVELYNHSKAISADTLVIANPGAFITDSIAPYADIFVTSEVSADTYIHHYQAPRSAFELDPANAKHLYHMIHSADESQYAQIMELSRARNAGWLFITSDNIQPDNNPYNGLPAGFTALVDQINAQGRPDNPKGDSKAPPAAAALGDTDSIETTITDAAPRILHAPALHNSDDSDTYRLPDLDGDALLAHLGEHAQTIAAQMENGQTLHSAHGDIHIARAGDAHMSGSSGEDHFILLIDAQSHTLNADTLLDFEAGIDHISLSGAEIEHVQFVENEQRLDITLADSGTRHSLYIASHDATPLSEADILKALHIL